MGVLFSYIKHWTQSIWIPIGLHFINNGLALSAYIANGESLDESTVAGSSWSYLGVLFVLAGLYGYM